MHRDSDTDGQGQGHRRAGTSKQRTETGIQTDRYSDKKWIGTQGHKRTRTWTGIRTQTWTTLTDNLQKYKIIEIVKFEQFYTCGFLSAGASLIFKKIRVLLLG